MYENIRELKKMMHCTDKLLTITAQSSFYHGTTFTTLRAENRCGLRKGLVDKPMAYAIGPIRCVCSLAP